MQEAIFGFRERRFHMPPLNALTGFGEGALDGRNQAFHPHFENVIGCAIVQRIDRIFFAELA